MKKSIIAALLAIIFAAPASAQSYRNSRYYNSRTDRLDYGGSRHSTPLWDFDNFADSYVGIRVGPTFTTVSSDQPELDGGSSKTGLNVGLAIGKAVSNHAPLFVETGLYYTEKGGKGVHAGSKFVYNLDYLEIPFVFKYRHAFDDHMKIEPFFGGYFAVGVGGKIKNFGAREAYSSFGSGSLDQPQFKRCDGGLKLGCGVSYDMFYAELGYDIGLSNICHDYFDTSKNGALTLNLGVNF